MKIVVDAMGGDYAPQAVIEGVIDALKEYDVEIVLIGIQDDIKKELAKYTYPQDRLTVMHAPEVISMKEPATTSIRKKRNSSITLGINLLNDKGYDAFISAGNTGAVVAAATFGLGMLPGVERPAIGLTIPTLKKFSFLIDVGANTDPKAEHLLQSAQMARVYVKEILGIDNPTIGLLNIGEEASKGSGFEKEAHKLLEEKVANFIGNVEANEIYSGESDCIICDGYTGNVVIKTSAGLMESAGKLIKREVKKDPFAILGAMLLGWRMKDIKKLADYSEYGGAPLLGVNGLVMISHGRSSPKAIKNAIRATMREIEHNLLSVMTTAIAEGK